MLQTPFYDPEKSYEENFKQGPFGAFADGAIFNEVTEPTHEFLGFRVNTPFGIPAGPLLNGTFVKAALDKGFDLPVYKTVRTRAHGCHPWPNVLSVKVEGDLAIENESPLIGTHDYSEPLSITNSFGVPSFPPEFWQKDLADAVAYAKKGQLVIGSFQGTKPEGGDLDSYIDDFRLATALMKETGVQVVEVNLSCPNEGTANLLCFDVERVGIIAEVIKKELGSIPLLLKTAYFADNDHLERLVTRVGGIAQGFSTINTIASAVVDESGQQALPGEGRLRSGVCGASIKWAGLEMTERLADLRTKLKMDYVIVGVGGVVKPADYQEYLQAGADAVMSATGAMWNPSLAQDIKSAS